MVSEYDMKEIIKIVLNVLKNQEPLKNVTWKTIKKVSIIL